ncbi:MULTISPECIES: hypothetical protein [Streptomyces]|uniref:Lactococcin 972 family bacteriocin n=2 Tax=Streptomyces TaxID=1883 RepID=A0A100Y7F5_9ACTN|nr:MULTISPECIES: hypothetical protein [Streptomyces]KUH39072.1 hypothetical protein ATE80_08910 [Streptomyces kanasensis]UUS30291.1 hypothetical protein NRO40_05220 [Streptomyces changanensis]
MWKHMSGKGRTAVVAAATAVAVVVPAFSAVAGEISGSRLPFAIATAGSKEDGDRWAGPGSGHARACGDVPTSHVQTFSGYVYEDVSWAPDSKKASVSKNYSSAYGCGSYAGTGTNKKYYTKASWAGIAGSRAYGYVNAQN